MLGEKNNSPSKEGIKIPDYGIEDHHPIDR